jgi:hypothetical protein
MANRYGEAALMAAQEDSPFAGNPVARWKAAMAALYPTSLSAQRKACPRGAFLGLSEEGLIKGIPEGQYAASEDNKAYAVQAVALLTEGKQSWSVSALWRAVAKDPEKVHDSQMDVVMALWKNDLIVKSER